MLDYALLYDSRGRLAPQDRRTRSDDWDEVQQFCRSVYMPYTVTPRGKLLKPDATMYSAKVGRVIVTRFSYGVPIHLNEFDPAAGNILVLNTLRGRLRHHYDASGPAETGPGDSFVVDCSRTDYWLDGDDQHMQLNLTIPHDVMAETAHRWFGFVPDNRLWTRRIGFGGTGTSWLALLEYVARSIQADSAQAADGRMGRHLEEMLCVELLNAWAKGVGIDLDTEARSAAPHYVRRAEAIMEEEARNAPTICEVASRVGVTARTLSEGFRRFRGISPRDFLRDRRLDGLRKDLMAARPGQSVTSVSADWGYVNFGNVASLYRKRFGELPSQTLGRVSRRH